MNAVTLGEALKSLKEATEHYLFKAKGKRKGGWKRSPEANRKQSEGMKKAWARRKAAIKNIEE